ncbi:glycosyltransferase family 2 protein [Rudaeicoccus suwonensis]|uniref:Glycosyl transferase family 2 n=1 Tax=Rudaeicoccus suwonensis TaxID=657409 RepID=A0A561E9K2_9MICO|nr:glycosyltransferase family 2 protein [Rudaeicoccus suwonensis]TWE12260.1 glycosyl transferase family 2 [Rudaeicoccus suwonensis]
MTSPSAVTPVVPVPSAVLQRTQLVMPCLNEEQALPRLLAAVPAEVDVVIADNGSTDRSVQIARAAGATVVTVPQQGYGAAAHGGLLAASAEFVVVMDADGSVDPSDALALVAVVAQGEADLALGRRRPVRRGLIPPQARIGNAAATAVLRHRHGLGVHDIAPVRAARRSNLLDLGVTDRAMGYPVELLDKAGRAGWRVLEFDVDYFPRAAGSVSKVSGTVRGTARTAWGFGRALW